jgi:predicted MFS family arabinose efflux permease
MQALVARFVPALVPARLLEFSPPVRRALRIDISVMLLFTLFAGLTTPFTGLILRRELGASPFQLSVLASASAACLLLSLWLTRLVDSHRPLPYVVWPTFLARGLFLLVPFIATPWPFVGVLVAGTLLSTVSGPAHTALVERVYPRAERGRALGTVRVTGALVAIGLALAAGQLLGSLGFRWVFAAAGLVGMAAALRQRRLPVPEPSTEAARPRSRLLEAWRVVREDHAYRRILLGSFLFGSGIWLMMPATPILLADVVRATPGQVGVLAAAGAVAALGGNLVWGRLADRGSSVHALRLVYVLGTLTPVIYYVTSVFAPTPWVLLGAAVAESLMHTGLDLVWMLALIELGGRERTTQYAAIGATLAGVRGLVGPLVGAAVIETVGLHAVYVLAAVLMAGGALLVRHHGQNTPRYSEQPAQTSGGVGPVRAALNPR